MNDFIISGLVIAAEIAVGLSIFFMVASYLFMLRRRLKNGLIADFEHEISEHNENRGAELQQEIDAQSGILQDQLEQRISALREHENQLCKRVLNIFKGGGKDVFDGLLSEIETLSQIAKNLYIPEEVINSPEYLEQQENLDASIKDRQELEKKLVDIKTEMSNLQIEFNALYAGGKKKQDQG